MTRPVDSLKAQMLKDAGNLTKKQLKAKGKKNAAKAARQAMSAVN